MKTKVLIPKTGMGITEGTIVKWLRAEGDPVVEGEALAEVEFAKSTEEIVAPAAGVLLKILVSAGDTVEVHTEIAWIDAQS